MIAYRRFNICNVFAALIIMAIPCGNFFASDSVLTSQKCSVADSSMLKKNGLNRWSFVESESKRVKVVAYLGSENTTTARDLMTARRGKYISELRLAKSTAPTKEIQDLYEEEIKLYNLGYKYAGKVEGWPLVISLPIYSSEGERTGVLIVCRKDQSKYDLVCEFKGYNDSEALEFISDTMNEIFDSLDFAEMKTGEPVFDNEGNLSHPDVLRVFSTARFLEQH